MTSYLEHLCSICSVAVAWASYHPNAISSSKNINNKRMKKMHDDTNTQLSWKQEIFVIEFEALLIETTDKRDSWIIPNVQWNSVQQTLHRISCAITNRWNREHEKFYLIDSDGWTFDWCYIFRSDTKIRPHRWRPKSIWMDACAWLRIIDKW